MTYSMNTNDLIHVRLAPAITDCYSDVTNRCIPVRSKSFEIDAASAKYISKFRTLSKSQKLGRVCSGENIYRCVITDNICNKIESIFRHTAHICWLYTYTVRVPASQLCTPASKKSSISRNGWAMWNNLMLNWRNRLRAHSLFEQVGAMLRKCHWLVQDSESWTHEGWSLEWRVQQ